MGNTYIVRKTQHTRHSTIYDAPKKTESLPLKGTIIIAKHKKSSKISGP